MNDDNLLIRREQVVARLRSYPEQLSAQLVVALALAAMLWPNVPHGDVYVWLGLLFGYWLLDAASFLFYRSRVHTAGEVSRWLRLATIMSSLSGLAWGAGAWLLFVPESFRDQTLLIMVLNGIAAGGIALVSTFAPSLFLFLWGLGLPMVARMASIPEVDYQLIALMLAAYFVFLTRAGYSLCETFQLAIRRGWERDLLNEALKREKNLAEEANLAKSRFLAAASHDLRQPLQALVLFLDVMESTLKEPIQTRVMGQINRSVTSLSEMFTQLLDLSRLDAGTVRPELGSFRLGALLEDVQNDARILAEGKGLRLELNVAGDVVVLSDRALLDRILRNLVSNAIRYTREGSVTLIARNAGHQVVVDVVDTGIGIPAGEIGHIFDEYYQINNPQRDRNQGLGLGLSIVRRTAKLLGIEIAVSSYLGLGTTFTLSIPPGAAEACPQDAGGDGAATARKLECVIALIEDDVAILAATQGVLQQWGAQVVAGTCTDELLAALREGGLRPAVIVSDYRLPNNETGLEAIARVQEFCGWPTPAIIITGDTGSQELLRLSGSGFPILHKPVQPELLRQHLSHLAAAK